MTIPLPVAATLAASLRAAGIPVDCVSVGVADKPIADKSGWDIQFGAEATDEQKEAAQAVIDAFDPEVAPVPAVVTPLQLRRALRAAGLKAAVEALIAGAGEEVQEAWNFAREIPRNDPLILAAAEQLKMTSEQVDDLFRAAAQF